MPERQPAPAGAAENDISKIKCPSCGALMRRTRIGGGARMVPAWVCPVSESERYRDETGHLLRKPDALHDRTRVWTAVELVQEVRDAQ